MHLGIVGHEAAKFTPETESLCRDIIRWDLFEKLTPDLVISGGCHLGGVDRWAIDEAQKAGIRTKEYKPEVLQWSNKVTSNPNKILIGYKTRNEQIAINSDIVVCLVVKQYPPDYEGMRFSICYHCKTNTHIKSGGCWTAKFAKALGKEIRIIEIGDNDGRIDTSI